MYAAPVFAARLQDLVPDLAAWEIERRALPVVEREVAAHEEEFDEEEEELLYACLAERGEALLNQVKFLRSMGQEGGPDWDRLRSTDWTQIDPWDFEQKELLAELATHAREAAEVHLLIVRPVLMNRLTWDGWEWYTGFEVYQRGLRPWLALDLVEALKRWLARSADAARDAIVRLLLAQDEAAATASVVGFILTTLVLIPSRLREFGVRLAGIALDAADGILRVLSAGGAAARFVPLI